MISEMSCRENAFLNLKIMLSYKNYVRTTDLGYKKSDQRFNLIAFDYLAFNLDYHS